jgi:hypothetical protein
MCSALDVPCGGRTCARRTGSRAPAPSARLRAHPVRPVLAGRTCVRGICRGKRALCLGSRCGARCCSNAARGRRAGRGAPRAAAGRNAPRRQPQAGTCGRPWAACQAAWRPGTSCTWCAWTPVTGIPRAARTAQRGIQEPPGAARATGSSPPGSHQAATGSKAAVTGPTARTGWAARAGGPAATSASARLARPAAGGWRPARGSIRRAGGCRRLWVGAARSAPPCPNRPRQLQHATQGSRRSGVVAEAVPHHPWRRHAGSRTRVPHGL